jgi:hypothetical protein
MKLVLPFLALAVLAPAQVAHPPMGMLAKDAKVVQGLHLTSSTEARYAKLLDQTEAAVDDAFKSAPIEKAEPGQDVNHRLYGVIHAYRESVRALLNSSQREAYDEHWTKWVKKHGVGANGIGQPVVLAAALEPSAKELKKLAKVDQNHKEAKNAEKLLSKKESKALKAALKGKATKPKIRVALLRAAWLTAY